MLLITSKGFHLLFRDGPFAWMTQEEISYWSAEFCIQYSKMERLMIHVPLDTHHLVRNIGSEEDVLLGLYRIKKQINGYRSVVETQYKNMVIDKSVHEEYKLSEIDKKILGIYLHTLTDTENVDANTPDYMYVNIAIMKVSMMTNRKFRWFKGLPCIGSHPEWFWKKIEHMTETEKKQKALQNEINIARDTQRREIVLDNIETLLFNIICMYHNVCLMASTQYKKGQFQKSFVCTTKYKWEKLCTGAIY
jgi:hypothetical protein